MNWQEFEDGLKNRVEAHETPLDTDALWDQLQQKKRRRLIVPLWWIFGGVCLLGTVFLFGLNWVNRSTEKRMPGHSVEGINEAQKSDYQANQIKNPNKNTKQITPATHSSPKHITQNTVPQSARKRTSSISQAIPTLQKPGNTDSNRPAGHPKSNNTTSFTNNNLAVSDTFTIQENIEIVNKNSVVESGLKTTDSTGFSAQGLLFRLETPPLFVVSTDTSKVKLPTLPYPFVPAIIKPVQHNWQVGIHTGLYSWGIIRSTSSTGDTLPLTRVNERLLEAVIFGIHGQKQMGDRWRIRLGAQYVRLNSVFEWQKTWLTQQSTQDITNYFINGDITKSTLPGATLVEKSRTVRNYNQITAINLPIDLQYRLPVRHGVLLPSIGIQPNFSQKSSGTILDKQGQPDKTIYSTLYTRNLGINLRLGLAFELPVGKHTVISLAPTGGIDLANRTAKGYAQKERFWQFGLSLGITRAIF